VPLIGGNALNKTSGIPDAWSVRSIAQAILTGRHKDMFYLHFFQIVPRGGRGAQQTEYGTSGVPEQGSSGEGKSGIYLPPTPRIFWNTSEFIREGNVPQIL
jgi:hypothetical protein